LADFDGFWGIKCKIVNVRFKKLTEGKNHSVSIPGFEKTESPIILLILLQRINQTAPLT
jgi:hypothetical protein